jgi:hypothetical protein
MASKLAGLNYTIAFTLYSKDGRREVEVREFSNGETYIVERELLEEQIFSDRHSGIMVGPFASPEDAESFIVATRWFQGDSE